MEKSGRRRPERPGATVPAGGGYAAGSQTSPQCRRKPAGEASAGAKSAHAMAWVTPGFELRRAGHNRGPIRGRPRPPDLVSPALEPPVALVPATRLGPDGLKQHGQIDLVHIDEETPVVAGRFPGRGGAPTIEIGRPGVERRSTSRPASHLTASLSCQPEVGPLERFCGLGGGVVLEGGRRTAGPGLRGGMRDRVRRPNARLPRLPRGVRLLGGRTGLLRPEGPPERPPALPELSGRCRQARAPGGPREYHAAICSMCGGQAVVPFNPRTDRPIYCSTCFDKVRAASSGSAPA